MPTPPINSVATSENAWRMFRIMGEFAAGFQALEGLSKAVAIFGSARTKPDHPHYQAARDIAFAAAKQGFTVITGGGPGIMEAANKGAKEGGGHSVGLCIQLPFEQSHNPYINRAVDFHYFFVRKVCFLIRTVAVVVMPGGFGTMDEVMETVTLVQTHKIKPMPIVLYETPFWQGLLDWLKTTMEDQHRYISPGDLDLFTLADSTEAVMQVISQCDPHLVEGEDFQLQAT
ncbi:MAG: TIGR00730 family Rossman fold protein [Planctomycetota bacterium]|nr:MAG: TIGR00730 family Rossman fold protein [Planctomycetota bacterium]